MGCIGGIAGFVGYLNSNNSYNKADISAIQFDVGGIIGYTDYQYILTNCYNSGNIFANNGSVGGIVGSLNYKSNSKFSNCHNTGNISSDSTSTSSYRDHLGEIHGGSSNSIIVENCTYLTKDSNVNANGATGVSDMTETMSMSNFVSLMNSYVTENNSDSTKTKLKTWKLENGNPVFAE